MCDFIHYTYFAIDIILIFVLFRLGKYIGNNKAIFDYLESSEQKAPDTVTKLDATEMAMLVHDQVKVRFCSI